MPTSSATQNNAEPIPKNEICSVAQHLEALRKRLIDISNRNKLVNFRPTKKACIEIAYPNVDEIFRRLTEEDLSMRLQAGIEHSEQEDATSLKEGRVIQITRSAAEAAQKRNFLPCLHDVEGLEARADYIRREAKAVLDETGINHLYIALGFLRWKESEASEEELNSPLLLIPVLLAREVALNRGGVRPFALSHDGGELFPNLSLIERLRADYGIELPRFGDEFADPEEYLAEIARIVRGKNGWKVEYTSFVSFFSFAKLRMYLDLDSKHWPQDRALIDSPLVQQVLEGGIAEAMEVGFGEVEVTDDHDTAHDIPLVVEADSSQHTAILKTWEDRNLVIEGPPGTGKSQTITNIIAAALYQGKTVLFVSEKLAALEVVKRNLDNVGLGDFCLELHSHKTRKQEVHASLAGRLTRVQPQVNSYSATKRLWRGQVNQLRQYVQACGRQLGPRTEEVYRLLGRAVNLRGKSIPAIRDPLKRLEIDVDRFENALRCLQEIGRHLQNPESFRSHPWRGFLAENTHAGDDLAIERELDRLAVVLEKAATLASEFERATCSGACPAPAVVEFLSRSGISSLPPPPEKVLSDIIANLVPAEASAVIAEMVKCASERGTHLLSAANTLSSGAILRNDLGEWLKHQSEIAISQRLGNVEIGTLHSQLPSLNEFAHLVAAALSIAEGMAELGLGIASTVRDIERFRERLKLCAEAPVGVHRLLYLEHRFPYTETILAEARAEAERLKQAKIALGAVFDFSVVPDASAVADIKKALRATGGTFFAIFCREYRDAKRSLMGFLRSRKSFRFPGILDLLERLEQWNAAEKLFAERSDYKERLGPGFVGIDTDWDSLAACIKWALAVTQEALPWRTVESLALADNQRKAKELLTALVKCHERLQEVAPDIAIVLDAILSGRQYRMIELRQLDQAAREWTEWLSKTLNEVFPISDRKTSTFEHLRTAATHLIDAKRLALQISENTRFKQIVGIHACGIESEWDSLSATQKWADHLRTLDLPQPLLSWLFVSEVGERLPIINKFLQDSLLTLRESEEILRAIRCFGTVDTKWLYGSECATWQERADQVRSIRAKAHLLQEWALFRKLYTQAQKLAAEFAVDQVLTGAVLPDQAHEAFDLAVSEFYGYEALRGYAELETFTQASHQNLIENFKKTDLELLSNAQIEIAEKLAKRRPVSGNGIGSVKTWTEWPLLRHELNKQKGHIPIRQLMHRAGRSLVALKPCLMMSPLSVAQFLDPRCAPFDLVVMDEASQIRPEDAIGAVARAKQLVVVGDTKQMPPSNYWNRTLNEDEEDDENQETIGKGMAQEAESILECAKNAFPPPQRLLWHYRSQHESLIRFSNHAYYDNQLIIFPACGMESGRLGIKFDFIPDGRYRAGSRVNEIEARIVAKAALAHLMGSPSDSLLVATFNRPQQEMIDELIEKYASEDVATLERLEEARNHPKEPFVVKNLENVQGDERDVVFISCTYGPDSETGVVYQRFGPIGGKGGRRRLNVLFTRAKRRIEIFASITHQNIVGKPGEQSGINDLRDYLRYAETGIIADVGGPSDQAPDSYFEEAVMRVVESAGFRPVPQVGVSGYRVDIGVENPSRPGEYVLGIECDGAMYHSSKSARDRDRLRQEVLERRGWKVYRIWSTDWFRQNQAAKDRLLGVLKMLADETNQNQVATSLR